MHTKVVLAFSGGLAARVALHVLRMRKGFEVITLTPNLGQQADPEDISDRAIELGAEAAHVSDLRARFAEEFVFPALRAGAVHESGCPLSAALARPLVVAETVKIARQEGCTAIAHGATGLGNDQVRFETAAVALAPDLRVFHPLRDLGLQSFENCLDYAASHDLRPTQGERRRFSIKENLWGVQRDVDPGLDPWEEVPCQGHVLTALAQEACEEAQEVVLGFEEGEPVTVDGRRLEPVELIVHLNELGGRHGIGLVETMEDRLLGMKRREVYEAPAAALLHTAKKALERLVLPRELLGFKPVLSRRYAQLVYDGLWFNELRESLDGFFRVANERITGEVRLRLHQQRIQVCGCRSPYTLVESPAASSSVRGATEGFIDVYSQSQRGRHETWAKDTLED